MPQASKYNYTVHDVIYFVGNCVCTFTVLSPRAACYYMRIDEISTDFVISHLILGKLLHNCQIYPFLHLHCTCVLNSIPYFRISAEGVTFIIRNKKSEIKNTLVQVGKRCSPEESEFNIEQSSDIDHFKELAASLEDDETQKLLVCI